MQGTLNLKKGFTLIELLIVMSIIAVLVTLAVSGYTTYRKAALADLAADGLVSQINEMRDKTIHGTGYGVVGEPVPAGGDVADENIKCYGLKFEKNTDADDGYKINSVTQKFVGKRVWKDAKWEYRGCDNVEENGQPLEMDQMVNIEKISILDGGLGTEVSDTRFAIRFVPPNASLQVLRGGALEFVAARSGSLVVKMRYGTGIDDNYARNVTIDLATGKAVKN